MNQSVKRSTILEELDSRAVKIAQLETICHFQVEKIKRLETALIEMEETIGAAAIAIRRVDYAIQSAKGKSEKFEDITFFRRKRVSRVRLSRTAHLSLLASNENR